MAEKLSPGGLMRCYPKLPVGYTMEDLGSVPRNRGLAESNYIHTKRGPAPHYTTSLDAAVSLVPKGWGWSVGDIHGTCESAGIGRPWAEIWKRGARPVRLPGMHRTTDGRCLINAAVPALALCIASLRARQVMEDS